MGKEFIGMNYVSDEKAVKKFVRQMLKNYTFSGKYVEQRYVPDLGCYRKIIKLSKNEDKFIESLSVIKRRIENFYVNDNKWIGITFPDDIGAPSGYNLWVEINEDTFGNYTFRVKDVIFIKNEISLKLITENRNYNNSSKDIINEVIEKDEDGLFSLVKLKEAAVFLFLLSAAIITGSGQLIMFLMEYFLKLLRELSHIIKVSTPIFVACLETLSRIFGYFCFLIACMWKSRYEPRQIHQSRASIQYRPAFPYENRYKALPYQVNSSVKITELN